MTQKPDSSGKVRLMLVLTPEDAKALRVKAAMAGCRGVSEYLTEFLINRHRITSVITPTYFEDHEDGTD